MYLNTFEKYFFKKKKIVRLHLKKPTKLGKYSRDIAKTDSLKTIIAISFFYYGEKMTVK